MASACEVVQDLGRNEEIVDIPKTPLGEQEAQTTVFSLLPPFEPQENYECRGEMNEFQPMNGKNFFILGCLPRRKANKARGFP